MEKNSQLRFPPKVISEPSLQRPVRWLRRFLYSTASSSLSCAVSQTTGKQKGTEATRMALDCSTSGPREKSGTHHSLPPSHGDPNFSCVKGHQGVETTGGASKPFKHQALYKLSQIQPSGDAKLCKHLSLGPSRPGSQAGWGLGPSSRYLVNMIGNHSPEEVRTVS